MSDIETIINDPEGKMTFGYSRKKNLGNYENEEVSVYLTVPMPAGHDPALFAAQESERFLNAIKAEVWDGLGLDMAYDDAGNPSLVETVTPSQPVMQSPPPPAPTPRQQVQVAPAPVPQAPPPAPRVAPSGGGQMAAVGVYAPPPGPCGDCGASDWWDNRADVDGRIQTGQRVGPDWKCKTQGCGHGVFRNGTFQYNKSVGKGPAVVQQVAQNMVPPDEAPF